MILEVKVIVLNIVFAHIVENKKGFPIENAAVDNYNANCRSLNNILIHV